MKEAIFIFPICVFIVYLKVVAALSSGVCNDSSQQLLLGEPYPSVYSSLGDNKNDGSDVKSIISEGNNISSPYYLNVTDRKDGFALGEVEITCSAPYPVQWGFRSFQQWSPVSINTARTSSSKFSSTLTYPALRLFHQLRADFPTCHKVGDTCVQTSVSVENKRLKATPGSQFNLTPNALFGKNSNCSLTIAYDLPTKTFYCQISNTSLRSVTIFPVTCSNPIECAKTYSSQESYCKPRKPTIPIGDCRRENGCARLTYTSDYLPAAAVCLITGGSGDDSGNLKNSLAMGFFYSLEPSEGESELTRYLNWNDANSEKMVVVRLVPEIDVIYAGQDFKVMCNASYYYFSGGMKFEARKIEGIKRATGDDGLLFRNSTNIDDPSVPGINGFSEESLVYVNTTGRGQLIQLPWLRRLQATFQFVNPGNYRISCKAPVWNTTEWVDKWLTVTVMETVPPSFSNGNETKTLYYEPGEEVTCLGFGNPVPQLFWTQNDSPILTKLIRTSIGHNDTAVWSSLKFPEFGQSFSGNFSCHLKNYGGEVEKVFSVLQSDSTASTIVFLMGIVALILMLFIPLVIYLFWKVRKQTRQIHYLTQEEVNEFLLGKPDYIPFQCDMGTYAYYLPYDIKFEIPREDLDIEFSRVLGSGEYGMVVHGKYRVTGEEVAIKTSKPCEASSSSSGGFDRFKALLSELKIMTFIGQHDHIVNLIGACTKNIQRREVFIALEFCENGSLLAFMRTHRHSFTNHAFVPEGASPHEFCNGITKPKPQLIREPSFLDDAPKGIQYVKMEDLSHIAMVNQNIYENAFQIRRRDIYRWSYQIAEGMKYISEKKIIHGDLAARNVLLTSKGLTAKIGDFGLSKRLLHYGSYTKTADTPLPIKWMAIECLQDFQFSAESDIWSFGVLLWEIFSLGEIPYHAFKGTGEEFLNRLGRGMRLNQPFYCDNETFEIMMKCWTHDRKQRPKFPVLSNYFKEILGDDLS